MSHMESIEVESDRGKKPDSNKSSDQNPPTQGSTLPAECEGDSVDIDGKRKRQKRKTSLVWDNFTVITKVSNGKHELRAQCIHCKKDYAYDSHKQGTTSYSRHSQVCLRTPRNGDVGAMIVSGEGRLQTKRIEQSVFRDMLSRCIIEHDLPFSFVEYNRIRMLLKYLNPDVQHICRKTVASDIYKLYGIEKERLKIELSKIPGRICFTSDLWTSITVEGYMCLTANYIDSDWKLKNKILSFCAITPPHTGMDLAMSMLELWKEWGIEKKVFSITLDNASNNDAMVNILRRQLCLEDDLLCKGDFFHIRCAAHILNLIVQKGLKVIGTSLHKIRESIKYVQASEARRKLFGSCVNSVGLKIKAGLSLDVPTRWNSTFKMLDRAILYREAFENFQGMDPNYTLLPTDEEWDLGIEISELLQPFDEITNLFSGSTYPTSNLYFLQVYKIKYWLQVHENSSNPVIAETINAMKVQFDKYWYDYSDILAMAAILDPRFKMTLLDYCFSNLSEETCEAKKESMRVKMNQIFEAYKSSIEPSSGSSSSFQGNQNQEDGFRRRGKNIINYDDFHNFRKKNVCASGKSALDMYLDEPAIDMKMFKSLNVLDYWKDNALRFGELSLMARDLLSIPITTVASESSFSIGSRVLSKYRSCLLPKNVQALICTRNWLRGFTSYDSSLEAELEGLSLGDGADDCVIDSMVDSSTL